MKKTIFLVYIFCALFSINTLALPKQHRVPPYNEWDECVISNMSVNVLVRVCADNYAQKKNVVHDIKDVIFEFKNIGAQNPSLLIFLREPLSESISNIINREVYVRFYTWDGAWVFVDATTFTGHVSSPKNITNLFYHHSPFGKLFYEFLCANDHSPQGKKICASAISDAWREK